MKLGLAEDRGRKLASAATPNHPDGSKDWSLRSAGNIRIKNEDGGVFFVVFFKKEGTFICLSYFSTIFNSRETKQTINWKKFFRPLTQMSQL